MARRPLVATLVTTAIGAVLGALLGAVVGRIIAMLGDETIQPSVPMAFCATLGFLIGAPAAAKGSLERFGAARATLGTAAAAGIVIIIVGGANVGSTIGGPALFAIALIATALAAVAATAIGQPQERPVAPAAPLTGPVRVPDRRPDPAPVDEVEPEKPSASSAARRVPTIHRFDEEDEEDDAEGDDWSTFGMDPPEPEADPEPPPRRREPLRAVRSEPEPESGPAGEPQRPRRERPLRRGDAE